MSKNVGRSKVGYARRKPRAQGTEMGVKQSVARSCVIAFKIPKLQKKTHFPKLVFNRCFHPNLARFGCFALKSGFVGAPNDNFRKISVRKTI